MTQLFGIIGYPLQHSFSPQYFNSKFAREEIDAVYELFSLPDVTQFPALIAERPQLCGLNVTLPHKRAIVPYMDELHDTAAAIGAVNCIAFHEGGMKGYNTDAIGFEQSLRPLLGAEHRRALVLGTGGSAAAVKYVLGRLDIDYLSVSRKATGSEIGYDKLTREMLETHLLIINCTPLGMAPDTESFPPIPYHWLSRHHLLYDLVYNPEETEFLKRGRAAGARTRGGLEMLYLQAEANWHIWRPTTPRYSKRR